MQLVIFYNGPKSPETAPEVPGDCSWLLSDFRLRLYPLPLCRFHWHRCRFLASALPPVLVSHQNRGRDRNRRISSDYDANYECEGEPMQHFAAKKIQGQNCQERQPCRKNGSA